MNFEAEKIAIQLGIIGLVNGFKNQSDIVMFSTIQVNTCYRNR